MKLQPFPLAKVYRLIEPGPVVMVTTARGAKQNVMTMAWHTMMEFTPPLIGCVISENDYSFGLLRTSKECVLAVPTAEMAATVVKVGNTTGAKIDKFQKFGLARAKASRVKAPLLPACYANLECRVYDTRFVKKYNFFVLEVVKAWIDPSRKNPQPLHHVGEGNFFLPGRKIKVPWRMSSR